MRCSFLWEINIGNECKAGLFSIYVFRWPNRGNLSDLAIFFAFKNIYIVFDFYLYTCIYFLLPKTLVLNIQVSI